MCPHCQRDSLRLGADCYGRFISCSCGFRCYELVEPTTDDVDFKAMDKDEVTKRTTSPKQGVKKNSLTTAVARVLAKYEGGLYSVEIPIKAKALYGVDVTPTQVSSCISSLRYIGCVELVDKLVQSTKVIGKYRALPPIKAFLEVRT